MAEFKDSWENLMFTLNPAGKYQNTREVPIRPRPRFMKVESRDEQSFSVTIPTARRTWWAVCLVLIVGVWFFFTPMLFYMSWEGESYTNTGYDPGGLNAPLFFFLLMVLVGISYILWRIAFPRIRIAAKDGKMTVYNRQYDLAIAQGFRDGYSLGGVERSAKQGLYSGLRVHYGRWGDDLPFLVRSYYAPAYIVFLNRALTDVRPVSPGEREVKRAVF